LGGCQKDAFNPEKVQATYEDKFPVKDIDPDQNWKMTKQVAVEIAVYEDQLTDYTVNVYDNDPADSTIVADNAVHLLASGIANRSLKFNTLVTCTNLLDTLYAARIDPVGRIIYKPMPISNGYAGTSFGNNTGSSTRAATRSITIPEISRPYSDSEIESMLDIAEEYVSGTQMDAEINAGTASQKVYKITSSTPFTINVKNSHPQGTIKLIIANGANAQHEAKEVIPSGVELIVAAGATFAVAGGSQQTPSMVFTGTSRLVVLGGDNPGHITGTGWIEFNNPGVTNYNGGVIEGFDGFNNKGGTFYNAGTIIAKYIFDTEPNIESLFINHSCLEATTSLGASASNAPIIENSCKLVAGTIGGSGKANGIIYSAGLTMGDNSSLHCGDMVAYNYLRMGNHSIIKSDGTATFNNCTVSGETGGEYAMLQLMKKSNVSKSSFSGNIYIETTNSNTFKNCISGGITFAKPGNAPVISNDTNCTFENYPETSPEVIYPAPLPSYTYVFEDNFPMVGDYDFNDIVLDVTIDYDRNSSNGITATKLSVTLTAVGAAKTLGAGLRIVNVPRSQLGNYALSGADASRFQSSLTNSLFGTSEERDNAYLTIPLFGDAHAVLGVPAGSITNTEEDGLTVATRTLVITIPQTGTDQLITKDNLDFFIGYQYKGMQKRMEVHLYEFWNYGATAKGTIQQTNLDLAGNNTWAICAPDFIYPNEYINICDESDTDNCGYPMFLNWARNRNVNQGWFQHPNDKNVYRKKGELKY
jgi:LruC domain-containing protein